jgi:hypothetical protein
VKVNAQSFRSWSSHSRVPRCPQSTRARIAAHARARRKHEVVTFPAHHQGIPLGARRADGKILVHIRQSAPLVEKRSLLAYESAANGGER